VNKTVCFSNFSSKLGAQDYANLNTPKSTIIGKATKWKQTDFLNINLALGGVTVQ